MLHVDSIQHWLLRERGISKGLEESVWGGELKGETRSCLVLLYAKDFMPGIQSRVRPCQHQSRSGQLICGSKVFSGQRSPELAEKKSPVLAAYQWYGDRCNTTRASYDPVTVLYEVVRLGDVSEFGNEGGFNGVAADGRNGWIEDERVANQHWLRLKDGVSNEEVGEMLDQLYAYNGLGG